ncbi:MAG TPA: Gfo/Idh/MocA family oxidoreductase [Solirubrobacteraceae bacterium]
MTDTIGVGMLGHAFMGQAHSLGLRAASAVASPPLVPELVSIAGRNREALERAATRFGWSEVVTDWREQVADPRIGLFDNVGPNALHAEPTIAAAQAGKHVLCEKPLGLNADEAHRMWSAAEAAGVVHMCAYNYRFFPAIRLARQMIEAGELGEIHHFRSVFLDASAVDPDQRKTSWRFQRANAGSGALGDLGAHHIDAARYLVGEPVSVAATVRTFVPERAGFEVDVDDAFQAVVEFENGAIGTIEASRVAAGHVNQSRIEIDGSKASLSFDVQSLNHLRVAQFGKGFRDILVTERDHPFSPWWFPPGHPLSWADSFTHELAHMLGAIGGQHEVAPHGATFEDGYRCAEVCDAILAAAASGARTPIAYRAVAA